MQAVAPLQPSQPPLPLAFPPGYPAASGSAGELVAEESGHAWPLPALSIELREVYIRYRPGKWWE